MTLDQVNELIVAAEKLRDEAEENHDTVLLVQFKGAVAALYTAASIIAQRGDS